MFVYVRVCAYVDVRPCVHVCVRVCVWLLLLLRCRRLLRCLPGITVGGAFYIVLRGGVDVYHTPWTHADDHVFAATSGRGVNVAQGGAASDAQKESHLGVHVGCVQEGEFFGDYQSRSQAGVRRTCSMVSRGCVGTPDVRGPTEVLKVSTACMSCCPCSCAPVLFVLFVEW